MLSTLQVLKSRLSIPDTDPQYDALPPTHSKPSQVASTRKPTAPSPAQSTPPSSSIPQTPKSARHATQSNPSPNSNSKPPKPKGRTNRHRSPHPPKLHCFFGVPSRHSSPVTLLSHLYGRL